MKFLDIIFTPIIYLILVVLSIISCVFYIVGNLTDSLKCLLIGNLDESKAYLNDVCENVNELKYLFVWEEEKE